MTNHKYPSHRQIERWAKTKNYHMRKGCHYDHTNPINSEDQYHITNSGSWHGGPKIEDRFWVKNKMVNSKFFTFYGGLNALKQFCGALMDEDNFKWRE